MRDKLPGPTPFQLLVTSLLIARNLTLITDLINEYSTRSPSPRTIML